MRVEGSWDWFAILAATTLSGREEACVVVLVDARGETLAAMPLVLICGQAVRGLTSPFTTHFCPPLGDEDNARHFGKPPKFGKKWKPKGMVFDAAHGQPKAGDATPRPAFAKKPKRAGR